jgi:hypothetical protein
VPAFTFEKISRPARPAAKANVASTAKGSSATGEGKQRSVIGQMLDRFVEARAKRTLRAEKGLIAGHARKAHESK